MTSWQNQMPKPVMPSCARHGNGTIPLDEMTSVWPKLGAFGYLAPAAARAWKAMAAAAFDAGWVLTTTGAYRPLAAQESLFRQRYTPAVPNVWAPGRKKWRDRWWSKNPGVAAAAVPGTSNHGNGIAVDAALEVRGAVVGIGPAVPWLEEHASVFGFGWELKSEAWHLRHVHGDDVTAAVIEYERASTGHPVMRRPEPMFLATEVGQPQVWLVHGNKRYALNDQAVSVYKRRPEIDPVPMVLTAAELAAFLVAI